MDNNKLLKAQRSQQQIEMIQAAIDSLKYGGDFTIPLIGIHPADGDIEIRNNSHNGKTIYFRLRGYAKPFVASLLAHLQYELKKEKKAFAKI